MLWKGIVLCKRMEREAVFIRMTGGGGRPFLRQCASFFRSFIHSLIYSLLAGSDRDSWFGRLVCVLRSIDDRGETNRKRGVSGSPILNAEPRYPISNIQTSSGVTSSFRLSTKSVQNDHLNPPFCLFPFNPSS